MATAFERRGWSRLLGSAAVEVVSTVQRVHRASSDQAFRLVGPVGNPVKRVHDAIVNDTYHRVRLGCAGAGELGAVIADRAPLVRRERDVRAGDDPSGNPGLPDLPDAHDLPELAAPWTAPWHVRARSIAHGALDERFFAVAPELDLDVTLRHHGHQVTPNAASLRRAYPAATGRIVVFVHGLIHTESSWFDGTLPGSSLPEVAAEHGLTPVLVRYGTGRTIGRNGEDLARLLDQTVASWPVPVEELTIVGHSMGGLLARAAAVAGTREVQRWVTVLGRVVYLGSPHLGSWLEKVANVTSWSLRQAADPAAPFGELIDARSRGIKDLRFGTLLEEGWAGADVDELLSGLAADEPWLDGVDHDVIIGRLHPTERHPLNLLVGDALVRSGSASGAGWRRQIEGEGRVTLVPLAVNHMQLPRHPEVAGWLRDTWGR